LFTLAVTSVLQSEGVLVDFLCRKAWTMKAPVLFSQKTGAPLLPAFIQRTAEGHKINFHPHMFPDKDIDIEIHLEILNAYLEEHIKEDPSQWLWIHRRWKRANA
jgi:KDO2-lipid IV(A) lauroyltransferase